MASFSFSCSTADVEWELGQAGVLETSIKVRWHVCWPMNEKEKSGSISLQRCLPCGNAKFSQRRRIPGFESLPLQHVIATTTTMTESTHLTLEMAVVV
jgi:hypothetical protein